MTAAVGLLVLLGPLVAGVAVVWAVHRRRVERNVRRAAALTSVAERIDSAVMSLREVPVPALVEAISSTRTLPRRQSQTDCPGALRSSTSSPPVSNARGRTAHGSPRRLSGRSSRTPVRSPATSGRSQACPPTRSGRARSRSSSAAWGERTRSASSRGSRRTARRPAGRSCSSPARRRSIWSPGYWDRGAAPSGAAPGPWSVHYASSSDGPASGASGRSGSSGSSGSWSS